MMQRQGLTVGFTSTSGIYVNDRMVMKADASGPKSARMVLGDPSVDVAVLETARGGMVREGLGFDRCDVGVVLNVTEDHMGLGGVEDLRDLAAIKSIVAESVARNGHAVLNADDPETLRMAEHAGGEVIWFTLRGEEEMSGGLLKHLAGGGTVLGLDKREDRRWLVIRRGEEVIHLLEAEDVPATLGGAAEFNIANALAAAAVGVAQGLSPHAIADALRTFETDYEHNPGRLNIYDGHGFRTIVDYAHNPAALTALGETVAKMRPNYGRVIAVVSMPGDRRDSDLRQMGAISNDYFDTIVFRERPDGRGRGAGEVVRLLAEGARQAGCTDDRIIIEEDEHKAAEAALNMARPGDLVVLMPTDIEAVWKQMREWRPRPVADVDVAGHTLHG